MLNTFTGLTSDGTAALIGKNIVVFRIIYVTASFTTKQFCAQIGAIKEHQVCHLRGHKY